MKNIVIKNTLLLGVVLFLSACAKKVGSIPTQRPDF